MMTRRPLRRLLRLLSRREKKKRESFFFFHFFKKVKKKKNCVHFFKAKRNRRAGPLCPGLGARRRRKSETEAIAAKGTLTKN